MIVDGCISKAQFGEFAETVDYTEKKVHLLKQKLILMEKMLANDRIEKRINEVEVTTFEMQ